MRTQGELLEEILRKNNVNIDKLSRDIGRSKQGIYNWFSMKRIKLQNLMDISKALEMDIVMEMEKIRIREKIKTKEAEQDPKKPQDRPVTEITVQLDGTEYTLFRAMEKLRMLNEALQKYNST